MGVFLKLLTQGELEQVMAGMEQAISRSFAEDKATMTHDELRRRFAICERLVGELRHDLGWGLTRALDHLPRALRCELDGIPWTPDPRKVWLPEDGKV